MRITTGIYRNRKLHVPKGIRPTQDKVRKAVFDILGDIEGLTFLELFAGSGAVGFEALSRGASALTLVELNRDSVLAIKKNIDLLNPAHCNLYHLEAEKAIKLLSLDKKSFDIIFIDPPYYKKPVPGMRLEPGAGESGVGSADSPGLEETKQTLTKKILQRLKAYDILSPYGLIVVQHSRFEQLSEDTLNFSLIKEAKYGDTWLSIFRKKE
jgi:16S rRNA (guanine966-N2)-methyltransferase